MTSISTSAAPNAKASSREAAARPPAESNSIFAGDRMDGDLVAQLAYMSAISTAGLSREQLFDRTSKLPYSTSGFFRSVRLMTSRLGYDYPRSCEIVAERTKSTSMRSFLLRFAGSLGSGERESDFLTREMEVQFENHRNKYERDLESLRKWTDGFVALEVSVALVVIIAIVSMMIFPMGIAFVLGLCMVGVLVLVGGAWVIWRSAPAETLTHNLPVKSPEQVKVHRLARFVLPAALALPAGLYALLQMPGLSLMLAGAILAPVGFLAYRYHQRIDARDADAAGVLRAIGGVTGAIGTTATEAIGRLDLRSMGNLQKEIKTLHRRLMAGIRADLCWERFVAETGSETVRRAVAIFWDAVRSGGDAAKVGTLASRYAMHVVLLRSKRALVANTFQWLMVPMHGTLVALLAFITEIFAIFSGEIVKAQQSGLTDADGTELMQAAAIPTTDLLAFAQVDINFVRALMLGMVLILTALNGLVPNAASGGDHYRAMFTTAIMLVISGITLTVVPIMTELIFGGLVVDPAV
jgi:flagellar protein FlaJ